MPCDADAAAAAVAMTAKTATTTETMMVAVSMRGENRSIKHFLYRLYLQMGTHSNQI